MFELTAVIFDMDGLMLDTERVARYACQRAAACMGYDVADEFYLRTVGRNEKDTRLIFMEQLGKQFPYDKFHEQWRRCRENIIEIEGVSIKPGLLELLDRIHCHEVPVAVATSTARAQAQVLLGSAHLAQRFDAIVCGDEIVDGKPAPDIFLKAAEMLDVRPAGCLVLEDSEPGIVAAHAAGMRAIIVPDLKPPSERITRLAWATCASLRGVWDFLLENGA